MRCWNASAVALQPNGTVRIHYDGWAASWDEEVTMDRVRLR
jgi:hypothetical protein